MTITSYGTGAYRAARPSEFVSTRAKFDDLQRQLDTGKKVTSYGDLGIERRTSLDLNAKKASLDSWLSGIQLADVNLKLSTKAVEGFAKLTAETKNDARPGSYVESASGRSAPQVLAEEKFKQALDLLNTNVGGRYLFSGRTSDTEPVVSYSLIMDGDGSGRAGLKQMIAERKEADLGLTGLGRLTAGGAGTTATIAEEAGNPNYGFKLKSATTTSAGLVPTYTAGPPADVSVNVAAQPQPGDTLRFKVDLPDGTQKEIVLTARAAGSNGSATDTFEIGADVNATAANLRASVSAAFGKEAQTTLSASSAQVAAKNFFDGSPSNPPVRVPGPPFATATAAPAPGTAANTVIWYQGDDAPGSARATSTVQVDQSETVAIGARANEEAFKVGLAQFAVFAAETFPAGDPNSKGRYEALAERVSNTIGYGTGVQKPAEIIVELGTAQKAMASAKERHTATQNYLTTTLAGVEEVTTEEVATQILALQTRLQASYQTTAILSKLTLTNYI
ncbi:hypothetical protein [Bosea sp. BIWAKO-01]|uniref:hypothetical protein n=1 Tax=Bosea sp. BIWAKO-01 TaxID=506668 RepID=UPI000852D984|nr:hypothetical protein [Bosea sp. BIWAKO-01]GAU83974.1 flagellar hook-associated protein FlgL [Bosea sp. BIWAKO-01]